MTDYLVSVENFKIIMEESFYAFAIIIMIVIRSNLILKNKLCIIKFKVYVMPHKAY